ncbi:PIR protein [Plasmodium yoelii]|uniref:Yir4 protein n=3 Tax=Plasmodium yoelii TaxID=5861 RepID=Q7RFA1_PLAYO|nr:PIR protein [Plasmodium yoelii]EAA16719.1 putative yir4 protein [Plasmodium yoelii yoelii]WBY58958.1 PIR protein [Plasmodium yoelii yoelii]CDS44265.1 YIR protein [Plasmodium yoelii]VTZ79790.1 PIR protein [Plasmodium yoelii]|eukprot:XP_022811103.1 PIR protein [Plasmodium yoelii]
MDKKVCEKFENVWYKFPDKLDSDNKYQFKKENFLDGYCDSYSCDHDVEKINAGFFYLLNQFFGSSGSSYSAQNNINVVDYIILWLSYMLNLKKSEQNMSNIQYFYSTTINNDRYKKSIPGVTEYKSYKDLIDEKKELMDISNEKMSKIYVLFKILCNMYTDFDKNNPDCNKHSVKAKEFVEEYKKLKEDYNITEDGPYYKLLSTLLNDYNNLKNKCSNIPPIPGITTNISEQRSVQSFGQNSEDISSSSIANNLLIVLSIFGAIAFFLGISYKYSLFGFRKQFQKQKLREKIKNIKNRMNH